MLSFPELKALRVQVFAMARSLPVGRPVRAGDEINEERDTDERLWHPWLRINRLLRVMLQTRWSTEAWSEVPVEFRRALALRSEIRRAGWFN